MHKIIFVTPENQTGRTAEAFNKKLGAQIWQRNRLSRQQGLYNPPVISASINAHLFERISFHTGQPFFLLGKYDDYAMIPAVELFEILGFEVLWDSYLSDLTVTIRDAECIISAGVPLYTEIDWARGLAHEIPPMLVDDVLFISHMDLHRIFMDSGMGRIIWLVYEVF